ncbi:MAG: segregation and condensation protein A [Anaerolineae bacterium]
MPNYQISLPVFDGPLDLLLYLIERQELDITAISLQHVAGQYLAQVEKFKTENRIEDLIDFLVIAARLVLIKSRALLPQTPELLPDDDEEEDPAEALARQLRQYKQFKKAAAWLNGRQEQGLRTYLRVAPPPRLESRLDLTGVTINAILAALTQALARTDRLEKSVSLVRPRIITIEQQISQLRHRIRRERTIPFHDLLSNQVNRVEVAVTLLAVLELIKRREIRARQSALFGPIEILPANETDAAVPTR